MAQWQQYNLEITMYRNDTLDIDITFTDSNDDDVPAAAFTSARCQVRASRGDTPVLTFLTSDGSMVLTDGNINLNKLVASTDIPSGKYIYDIEFTLASTSQVVTPIVGQWIISNDRTY